MLKIHVLFTFLAFAYAHFNSHQEQCNELCAPDGVTSETLPEVGPALSSLYQNIIDSINPPTLPRDSVGPAQRRDSSLVFCCAMKGQCYLLQSFDVPFCYDEFTTGFSFPDGSYGTVVTGNYSSASGAIVNLLYGEYKAADGSTGNIYTSTSKPDTSTMPMPTPWTSTGVGTAIPASELGSMAIITTTSTDSVVTAITLPSLTISAGPSACTLCIGNHSVASGPIITGTGIAPSNMSSNLTATTSTNSTSGTSIIIPPFNRGTGTYGGLPQTYVAILAIVVVLFMDI